jgi:hypothetical protein
MYSAFIVFLHHVLSIQPTEVMERSPRPVVAIPVVIAYVAELLVGSSPNPAIASTDYVLLVKT